MGTNKRQLSFYAEADVDLYLSYMTPGSKTAILNDAIKMRMGTDAMVDLNDGKKPVYFAALSELEQKEVNSNLTLAELSYDDVDEHLWAIIRETSSRNWKDNTRRYLTLHQVKFKEPFRIKKIRSREEIEEFLKRPAFRRTKYYCDDHTTKNADLLTGVNFGELKCGDCGRAASYREYK